MSLFKNLFMCALMISNGSFADENPARTQWNAKMTELSQLLPRLMSELSTPKKMYSVDSQAQILKDAKRLSELADNMSHSLKTGQPVPSAGDPTMIFLSQQLGRDSKWAAEAIERGHWEYGRQLLQSLSGRCIACHTRHKEGPEFAALPLKIDFKSLSTMERAELYAATRQFKLALSEFEKIALDASFIRERQIDWDKALKSYLAIVIRFENDPAAASALISKILKIKNLPIFIESNLKSWSDALKETSKSSKSDKDTDAAIYAQAKEYVSKGKALQSYPNDRKADIYFLQASARLHDLLTEHPKSALRGEALFLMAQSYEVLRYPSFWGLHDSLYEQCIVEAPGTVTSKKCYERYEESVHFGYSGSGGTSIPNDVEKHLQKLKNLTKGKK